MSVCVTARGLVGCVEVVVSEEKNRAPTTARCEFRSTGVDDAAVTNLILLPPHWQATNSRLPTEHGAGGTGQFSLPKPRAQGGGLRAAWLAGAHAPRPRLGGSSCWPAHVFDTTARAMAGWEVTKVGRRRADGGGPTPDVRPKTDRRKKKPIDPQRTELCSTRRRLCNHRGDAPRACRKVWANTRAKTLCFLCGGTPRSSLLLLLLLAFFFFGSLLSPSTPPKPLPSFPSRLPPPPSTPAMASLQTFAVKPAVRCVADWGKVAARSAKTRLLAKRWHTPPPTSVGWRSSAPVAAPNTARRSGRRAWERDVGAVVVVYGGHGVVETGLESPPRRLGTAVE